MTVRELLPVPADRPVAEVLDRLDASRRPMPFDPAVLGLLGDLSRRLLAAPATARQPDAVALGFWLRPANLKAFADRYPPPSDGSLRVPAGLAFHVPPANVDTLFAYSWAAGLLAGNRQIVRLSRRRGELADRLLAVIGDSLAAAPDLAAGTAFIEYDRDEAITAAISARCDLRIIWGGDATVLAIRAVPLAPRAREAVFADRTSLAVLSAATVQALDAAALARLAGSFFNDVLTFDQMACSSPRQLVWVGTTDEADAADERLRAAMAGEITRRGYELPPAVALAKYAAACRTALRMPVRAIHMDRTDWIEVDLGDTPTAAVPDHPGGGFVNRCRIDRLADLFPLVERSMQTMSYFGFERTELAALAQALAGRGIDRMVPVGQALAFDLTWDGQDLIEAFTRRVTIWP
jgi:hypothetical protein